MDFRILFLLIIFLITEVVFSVDIETKCAERSRAILNLAKITKYPRAELEDVLKRSRFLDGGREKFAYTIQIEGKTAVFLRYVDPNYNWNEYLKVYAGLSNLKYGSQRIIPQILAFVYQGHKVVGLIQQFVPGKSLKDAVRELSYKDKKYVLQQIREQLDLIHRHGFAHGELISRNIFVQKSAVHGIHVRFIDFTLPEDGNDMAATIEQDEKDFLKIKKSLTNSL